MASTIENVKDDTKSSESSTRLPMVDLKTAIEAVIEIRNKAVEDAPMATVAEALGYASPTSSPFYRRVSSAKVFNLLSQKSSLTQAAIDYIKPHDEGTKASVLRNAIMGIPYYKELIDRYANKKLNIDLLKNLIAKDCGMEDVYALVCARAFEASLKFAGMIGSDGVVQALKTVEAKTEVQEPKTPIHAAGSNGVPSKPDAPTSDTQEHVLYLDKNKSRCFSFNGPLEISRPEFERICKWLEFTMLIKDGEGRLF